MCGYFKLIYPGIEARRDAIKHIVLNFESVFTILTLSSPVVAMDLFENRDVLSHIVNYLDVADIEAFTSTCISARRILPDVLSEIRLNFNLMRMHLGHARAFIGKLLQGRVKLETMIPPDATYIEFHMLYIGRFNKVRYVYNSIDQYILEELSTVESLTCVPRIIHGGTNPEFDPSLFRNVRELNLSRCNITNVAELGRIHTLNLSECKINDVSALGRVRVLNLCNCDNVVDVSALGNVNTLNLSNSCVLDVSGLGNVHILKLNYCLVSDVSGFGRADCTIHSLSLDGCPVSDVSALRHIYELSLVDCHNLVDVSALGTVHTLDLENCQNIVDVSALGNVHTLTLNHCNGITDVSRLGNVKNLNLRNCENLVNIPRNGRHLSLDVSGCYNLTDLTGLGTEEFIYNYCILENFENFNAFVGLKSIDLSHSDDDFQQLDPEQYANLMRILAQTPVVFLSGCDIEEVSAFATGATHTLGLNCTDVSDVSMLGHLKYLDISGTNVTDVSMLGGVEHLVLSETDN